MRVFKKTMKRLPRLIAVITVLALMPLEAAFALTSTTDFKADAASVLKTRNSFYRALQPVSAALFRTTPLIMMASDWTWSAEAAFGEAIMPDFAAASPWQASPFFAPYTNGRTEKGESLPATVLNFMLGIPSGFHAMAGISYLPPLSNAGVSASQLQLRAGIYKDLLEEAFYGIGLSLGAGYTWSSGQSDRALFLSSSGSTFSGSISTKWNQHLFDGEIFIYKTLFVINFYSRANFCAALGPIQGAVTGSLDGASVTVTTSDNDPITGLVLAAGMEFIIGPVKISAEAGRDWQNGGLYGGVGVRGGF